MDKLTPYLPALSVDYIAGLLDKNLIIIIKGQRKTKLGDFRPSLKKGIPHKITINNNLNKYSFLITLVHEIAHLKTWERHQRKVLPHGQEWKEEYKTLMLPLIRENIFPDDLLRALAAFLIQPKASSCSDTKLYKALKAHDDFSGQILLENIAENSIFIISHDFDRKFRKGKKLRTRFLCQEITSGKKYVIHPLAEVKIVENITR